MIWAFMLAIGLIWTFAFGLTGKPDLMLLGYVSCGLFAISYELHYLTNRIIDLRKRNDG